jgi:SAM-dependent methyltransferase
MIEGWKIPHIIKGMLTWLPMLNRWRQRHASAGASDSPRYCYSVWLRHLITLDLYGCKINGARVGELGPGGSIGTGLAALLSGAASYVGLDIVPFSAKANLEKIFDELVQIYSRRESIPDHNEFPGVRPRLTSYEFPDHLVDWTNFTAKTKEIRTELRSGMNRGQYVNYRAPWNSRSEITAASLDLVFSQAVLEHIDALEETYQAMFTWLKPGGYASHVIDFRAHYLSPFWNGHWAYSEWEWHLVRGRREFLLNREPLSTHLTYAEKAGFEVLLSARDYENTRDYDRRGLSPSALAKRFQIVESEDLRTRGAVLVLRKR